MNPMHALLELTGITKYFGGLAAVKDLDLTISEGQIVGLIGPTAPGKQRFSISSAGFSSRRTVQSNS